METLTAPPPRIARAAITAETLSVQLEDGRSLSVPLSFYPTLQRATAAARRAFRLETPWTLRWPKLDYDLGVEGLLAGAHERPNLAATIRAVRRSPQRRLNGKTTVRRKALVTA